MIEVHHIAKSFGPVKAVHDVSFAAPDGLITGLLGPNGAGKTTTMRMITGVLKPDHGTTMIDGYDTKTQSLEIQRRLGALPDNRGLYPRLTARENIRYYGQLHDMDGKTLEANINTLIDLLDMHDIADRRTEGFSSGERVKVAIARALVHQPQNIILDEPTTGLDIMSTRAMRQFIRRLRDEGRCVLFTSHIMQEVAALCQNIVIVAHGRVSAQGSPDELRQATGQESLEDAFVDLIGSGEGLE
jgi:sodium transport system ATP-binding protein